MKRVLSYVIASVTLFQLRVMPAVAENVHGANYLNGCSAILTGASDRFEEGFLKSAQTREQIIQLLFDGGVIFSQPYEQGLIAALGLKSDAILDSSYGREVATKIKSILTMSDGEMNRFVWSLLDSEKTAIKDSRKSGSKARLIQVTRLIDALKKSEKRELIEATLRDVVTQTLLELIDQAVESYRFIYNDYDFKDRLIAGAGFGGLFGAIIGTGVAVALMHLSSAPSTAAAGLAAGLTILGIGTFSAVHTEARDYFRSLRLAKVLNDFGKNRITYVLPKYSYEIRMNASNIFKSFNVEGWADDDRILDAKCDRNTCTLNPIQLAYIGEIELIELEGLLNHLGGSATHLNASSLSSNLNAAVQAVHSDPNNYDAQLALRQAVNAAVEASNKMQNLNQVIFDDVITGASRLKRELRQLTLKAYTDERGSHLEIAKGQLLLERTRIATEQVDAIMAKANAFKETNRWLLSLGDAPRKWLEILPRSPAGWGEAAAAIQSDLQYLQAAGEAPTK